MSTPLYRSTGLAAAGLAALLGLSACGTTATDTTPPPRTESSAVAANSDLGATLEGLPKPTATQPLLEPTVEGDQIQQSYEVTGTDAEALLSYYVDHLDGWRETTPVTQDGEVWHGTWSRSGYLLKVDAEPSPNDQVATSGTQLDLTLTAVASAPKG